jgi:hypothetical protein
MTKYTSGMDAQDRIESGLLKRSSIRLASRFTHYSLKNWIFYSCSFLASPLANNLSEWSHIFHCSYHRIDKFAFFWESGVTHLQYQKIDHAWVCPDNTIHGMIEKERISDIGSSLFLHFNNNDLVAVATGWNARTDHFELWNDISIAKWSNINSNRGVWTAFSDIDSVDGDNSLVGGNSVPSRSYWNMKQSLVFWWTLFRSTLICKKFPIREAWHSSLNHVSTSTTRESNYIAAL